MTTLDLVIDGDEVRVTAEADGDDASLALWLLSAYRPSCLRDDNAAGTVARMADLSHRVRWPYQKRQMRDVLPVMRSLMIGLADQERSGGARGVSQ